MYRDRNYKIILLALGHLYANLGIPHFFVGSALARVERFEIASVFEEEIFGFEIGVCDLEAMEKCNGRYQLEHDVPRVLNRVWLKMKVFVWLACFGLL